MHIIIIIVVLAIGGAFYYRTTREVMPETTTPQVEEAITQMPAPVENAALYADGTYTKEGTYTSPAGSETVGVSITLTDGIVTDATFKGSATNPGSVKNQEKFAAGFKGEVIGKPLDAISLTVVNGSSLTPQGFMDALSEVKKEARS